MMATAVPQVWKIHTDGSGDLLELVMRNMTKLIVNAPPSAGIFYSGLKDCLELILIGGQTDEADEADLRHLRIPTTEDLETARINGGEV
ncbi:hypothetical protein PG987_013339 [Apiospora arundinis]